MAPTDENPQKDTEIPGFIIGKSLIESARAHARQFTSSFYEDWRFLLGENHYGLPASVRALATEPYKSRPVRNWLFASVDHKSAVVLDASPQIHVEPLTDDVNLIDRLRISTAVKHELERLRWDEHAEDVFWDGSALGVGLTHIYVRQDPLTFDTEEPIYEIKLEHVDPARFYPDPSASRLSDCRFVCYEPLLDLSRIREMFPEKADKVKPDVQEPITNLASGTTFKPQRNDSNLIYGPGQELMLGGDSVIRSRKANVAFIWVKDESTIRDVEIKVLKGARPGLQCTDCSLVHDEDDMTAMGSCPGCGGTNLTPVEMPPKTEEVTRKTRQYPFGRLIVLTREVLLYDGPNPHDIDTIFPFASYHHYRVPRRFWGYGDVALLKSPQRVADKNMAQLLDYMRLGANGPFEYPSTAEAYQSLGNAPGQPIPVEPALMGMARYVPTAPGFNIAVFQVCDAIVRDDFQRVSGITDVSLGVAPASPTSGVEVQARQRAASTRIGSHMKRLNNYRSDVASIVWQLMAQYYGGLRNYRFQGFNGELTSVQLDVSTLPAGVRIAVSADLDEIEKDKLAGQNLVMFLNQPPGSPGGVDGPFADLTLAALGTPPAIVREFMERKNMMEQFGMGPLAPQPVSPVPGASNGKSRPSGGPKAQPPTRPPKKMPPIEAILNQGG